MSKVLLDTDILSEYLKGHDKVVAHRAASYASHHRGLHLYQRSVHEIVFGLEFKGASGQLAKALAWLNQNEQITPTADDYREAAIIRAVARKQGCHSRTAGLPDRRGGGSARLSVGDREHG